MPTTATSTEWERVVNTTIREYLKGEENAIFRRRVLLKKLRSGGRVILNKKGDGFEWKVRYRRADMVVNNGQQQLSFQGENRWKRAFLDYEGYAITDAMTKREYLKNRSPQAIIKVYEQLIPLLMEDLEEQFAEELYVDSSAAGNTGRFSGIESMMGTNGTVNITSGAQRTANAADVVGMPDDTYATIDTDPGAYGGTWQSQTGISSTWPSGRGDPEYDFWSPTIVNYTSTAFGGATDTWADQCVESTRFGIRKMKRNKVNAVPLILMDDDLYRQYLNKLDSKERINLESKGMRELGFEDAIRQDGADITSEFGIPSAVGYGFDIDNMELLSMQGSLFESEGPEYDMATRSYRVAVDLVGQLKFKSPRCFLKLMTLA